MKEGTRDGHSALPALMIWAVTEGVLPVSSWLAVSMLHYAQVNRDSGTRTESSMTIRRDGWSNTRERVRKLA